MSDCERFSCTRDAFDAWMVWDAMEEKPAEWPLPLTGLGEIDARALSDFLNLTDQTRQAHDNAA